VYLTPPAKRTVVIAVGAVEERTNYGVFVTVTNVSLADPNLPTVLELEPALGQLWSFSPNVDACVTPADLEVLSKGSGSVYGPALCVASELANDGFASAVEQARYFGVSRGQGGPFVSARTQVVHAVRGERAWFDVLSQGLNWRHGGPASGYFVSGILYETITNRNVTELQAFFTHLTETGEGGPHVQLAYWAIHAGLTVEGAQSIGASKATLEAAIALLDGLDISTGLSNPPPPPHLEQPSGGGGLSAGFWTMVGLGAAVTAGAALWVWNPPSLRRGRGRR
jgi:hypothetical protein